MRYPSTVFHTAQEESGPVRQQRRAGVEDRIHRVRPVFCRQDRISGIPAKQSLVFLHQVPFGDVTAARRVRRSACRIVSLLGLILPNRASPAAPSRTKASGIVTYSNARLPEALIRSGARTGNEEMVAVGLESLDWLVNTQRCETKGHFVPIGTGGFYSKKTQKARFDQQPVEACAAISACLQAYRVTGKAHWREEAWSAFNWFLGRNDLNLSLYDPTTGG